MAPVALPADEPAFAELQVERVFFVEQSAGTDIAEREVDFPALPAADVIELGAQRAGGGFLVHAERQWRVVRQGRDEGRRIGAADRRQLLRKGGQGAACDQQHGRGGKRSHDATFTAALASSPPRNGSTASMKACGWSMLTACPEAGTTRFFPSGI